MKVMPPTRPQPVFGIYLKTNITKRIDETIISHEGKYKNNKITIYNAFNEKGILEHKLFYISDLLGNFKRFRLDYFNSKGKKIKSVGDRARWTIQI